MYLFCRPAEALSIRFLTFGGRQPPRRVWAQ
jgi:hypothetical protein